LVISIEGDLKFVLALEYTLDLESTLTAVDEKTTTCVTLSILMIWFSQKDRAVRLSFVEETVKDTKDFSWVDSLAILFKID
jgi:hypothetical protein